jgi:hypothetical protein
LEALSCRDCTIRSRECEILSILPAKSIAWGCELASKAVGYAVFDNFRCR